MMLDYMVEMWKLCSHYAYATVAYHLRQPHFPSWLSNVDCGALELDYSSAWAVSLGMRKMVNK